MSLVPGNLVHETSVTTGTGNQTLVAVSGKRTFNTEHSTGGTDVFDYFISNPDAAEWERGTGHMSTSTILVRDTVIQSSNSDSAVSFTAGTKNVTNDLPSSEQAGVWDLLETVVASADTEVDIINLSSTYFAYKFIWSGLLPASDNVALWVRTDANNGASFDAAGSDYAWAGHSLSMQTSPIHSPTGDNADAQIEVSLGFGTNANELADIEVLLFDPSATEYTKLTFAATFMDAVPRGFFVSGAGVRLSAALVDAVRFLFSTGNIEVGTLKVYGMRA